MLELSQDVVVGAIQNHPAFQGLSPEEATEFSQHCTVSYLDHGQDLFCQGDDANDLYLVLLGELILSCKSADEQFVVVGRAEEATILGEMGVFDDAPRSATATADRETAVLSLPGQAFAQMIDLGHPAARGLLRWLQKLVCGRLRDLDERLDLLLNVEGTQTQTPSSPEQSA